MKPWYERDPDRLEPERKFWLKQGFTESRPNRCLCFTGNIVVSYGAPDRKPMRETFKVKVSYPSAFPYRPPDVEFVDPRIRRSRHQSPDGKPCLFPPRAWTPFTTPHEFYRALERWLVACRLGRFPRELAIYELPEYFIPSPLSVLVTPSGLDAMAACHGRFALTCAVGRDLAVLKSVDGRQMAQDLLDGLRLGAEVKQEQRNGEWFHLSSEPPAIRNTTELSQVLSRDGHRFSADRRPGQHALVGLVFEDAVLAQQRLQLLDYSSSAKAYAKPAGWSVSAPWTYMVSEEELFRRLEGVRDTEALSDKCVVLLGAGAIGSPLATDLVRESVGRLVICDPDRLRPGNLVRHLLDLMSVGQGKAEATELAAVRINPYMDTWSERKNLGDPEVLANLMRADHPVHPADLVVSAIGDDGVEFMVSELAVTEATAPVLFVRTLHDGDAVRLVLLRPGQADACLECLRRYAEDGHPDLVDVPDSELAPVFDAGCATAAQPGAGLTSRLASIFAAKRTLSLLQGEETSFNQWLWVDRAIPSASDPRLHAPEQMYASHLGRHPDCPFCSV